MPPRKTKTPADKAPVAATAKKPKLPQPKESDIVKEILLRLPLMLPKGQIYLWRNNTGATITQSGGFLRYGEKGSPDILGILAPQGIFLAIEVKAPKGVVRPEQEEWLERARTMGAIAGVVRSLADAEKLLREGAIAAVQKAVDLVHAVTRTEE
jgi:hypothetical protein